MMMTGCVLPLAPSALLRAGRASCAGDASTARPQHAASGGGHQPLSASRRTPTRCMSAKSDQEFELNPKWQRELLGGEVLAGLDVQKLKSGAVPSKKQDVSLTVGQAMSTDVATLKVGMDVREAMKILLSWGVSGGPVVDEEGRIVGVLSETDLLWKEAGLPEDEYLIPPITIPFIDATIFLKKKQVKEDVEKVLAGTVGEAMTTKIMTAREDMLLRDAAKILLKMKVNRLPVVDAEKRVVGIVTRSDIIKFLADEGCDFMLDSLKKA